MASNANKLVVGVDEAGRGPVLGPMVVGAVWATHEELVTLQELGVRDSKRLSPKRRLELRQGIEANCTHFAVRVFPATELDANLNTLCRQAALSALEELPAGCLEIDAPVAPRGLPAWRADLLARLPEGTRLEGHNHAEDRFPSVAAASILAKTTRDALLLEAGPAWEESLGPMGSGYPSDPKTRAFVRRCIETDTWPDCVRMRWATVERIRAELGSSLKAGA